MKEEQQKDREVTHENKIMEENAFRTGLQGRPFLSDSVWQRNKNKILLLSLTEEKCVQTSGYDRSR